MSAYRDYQSWEDRREYVYERASAAIRSRGIYTRLLGGAAGGTITIDGFLTRRVDDHTLEVEVQKGQHLNQIFTALDGAGIHISSMRNRANRLEEMFVNLVEGAA